MSATAQQHEGVVVDQLPAEVIAEESLLIRQARALVIASVDDYEQAGKLLNSVVMALKRTIEEHYKKKIKRWYDGWQAEIAEKNEHLGPVEEAEQLIKAERVRFFREHEAREERERKERERAARAIEEERQRQEAAAERQRVADEAERIRKDAEDRRIAAEAEAERQANLARERGCSHAPPCASPDACADKIQREADEQARIERERAEAEARRVEEAGAATAKAIENEPVHLALPSAPAGRLTGVAKPWGVDKENWNPVAFALWIAGNPPEGSPAYIAAVDRAKYIGEPAWALLTAEAKQKKNLFDVGGITAGPKYSGRAGRS